jgi:hypothetical protein
MVSRTWGNLRRGILVWPRRRARLAHATLGAQITSGGRHVAPHSYEEAQDGLQRRGIRIVEKVDRGQQIIDDPQGYFDEARARAAEQVERDMERERKLEHA